MTITREPWMDAIDAEYGTGQSSRPAPSHADLIPLTSAKIPNGFYTLTFPDGSHRTFRVWTQTLKAKFMPGRRLIGMLIGPDNTEDYERIGNVSEEGIAVWKRFKNTKQEIYAGILWDLATGMEKHDDCELLISKRCMICNRELSTPESIERNIGPLCWERIHG